VILLLSDEHRWHSMAHTAMPELRTPELTRLAAEGASFPYAISNYPLCAPFRAMLLSGRWPYQTGVLDNGFGLEADEPTLARAFSAAGYTTGYVGKLHLANWTASAFGFHHSIVWQDSDQHTGGRWTADVKGEWHHNRGRYNASVMTDQALAFVERHRSQPFLLVLSWNPPHAVFTDAPEAKRALYPKGVLSYRPNYREPPQLEAPFAVYQGYHAHISAIDDEIARVRAALEALGLERETIVVYTSDHGSMQGSFGLTNKRYPHDESIRVPFLVWAPGRVAPGARGDAVIGAIDMAPTIAGIAGVPALPGWVGLDHSAALRGEPGPDSDAQPIMHILDRRSEHLPAAEHEAPRFRGIRTKRWTYAVRASGPWLLFDNDADPNQLDNLAANPGLATTRAALADRIAAWLADADDPFRLPASAWQ
jgi:arylsulfatase A-like enzyme